VVSDPSSSRSSRSEVLVSGPCCLASIFQGLEDLTIVAQGSGFCCPKRVQGLGSWGSRVQQQQQQGSGRGRSEVFVGGVHVMLAAGLPHAKDTLQRIHISTPGVLTESY
jgi:hypothetical protein